MFVEMPEILRDKYQYFTEAKIDKLKNAGYRNEQFSLLKKRSRIMYPTISFQIPGLVLSGLIIFFHPCLDIRLINPLIFFFDERKFFSRKRTGGSNGEG